MLKTKYFSLGGQDEKWKYSGVLEVSGELFVLNMGIGCNVTNQYGIHKKIPDLSYLKQNSHRIKGLFIGTPKALNIGSIPYFLDFAPDVPIYTSFIGKEIILSFLEDFGNKNNKKYNPTFVVVSPANEVSAGNIKIFAVKVANAIPNSYAWMFKLSSEESVVFVDEFLIANENVPCCENQLHLITQNHKGKIILLIVGTQSVQKVPSFAYQQAQNFPFLKKACASTKKRVIVALYEDDWFTLLNLSKIAKIYSMHFHITSPRHAKLFNIYLDSINKSEFAYSHKLFDSDNSLIAVVESHDLLYSELQNILDKKQELQFQADDLFLISTITYPEKELEEINLVNNLSKEDVIIVKQPKNFMPYCGGNEDIKCLINAINPFNIIPVNCYYKDYIHFCKALENTTNPNRIKFLEIGEAIEIEGKKTEVTQVPVTEQYVNSEGIVEINKYILAERQSITEHGAIIVSIVYNSKKHALVVAHLDFLGVFEDNFAKKETIKEAVQKGLKNDLTKFLTLNSSVEIKNLKFQTKKIISHAMEPFTHKSPLVLPLITNLS